MKKLICVFAAMAFVGSLAAQKKKPAAPAAPAAKPAVAMPAAVTTAAAVAPAMAGSSKGMGIFVEGFGSFTVANGTASSSVDGSLTGAQTYKLPNSTGFGGGGIVGYQIMQNLGLVATFEYRSIKSREYAQTNTSATNAAVSSAALTALSLGAGTGNATIQNKRNTMIIGLGIRPSVEAGPGRIYVGAGAAIVLPYDDVTTYNYTGANPTATELATATTTKTTSLNLAIGAYAELGYQFNITDMIYLGIGGRMLVATTNDKDKDTVLKTTGANGANTLTSTVTTTGSDAIPSPNTATVTSGSAGTAGTYTSSGAKTSYNSQGITDFAATVSVGIRF